MKKYAPYFIIVGITLLLVGGVVFFVFTNTQNSSGEGSARSGFLGSLFPFGQGNVNTGNNTDEDPLIEGGEQTPSSVPLLRKVSVDAVSGGFVFDKEGVSTIRFVNRATGHMYETVAEESTVTRISNTTIPGIQEVLWVTQDRFIIRYLEGDSISSFFATLEEDIDGAQSLSGFFIDPFMRGVLDPQKESLLSIAEQSGSGIVSLSSPERENARTVFSSPLLGLIPLQSDAGLFVYTAPSGDTEGFLYQIVGGSLIKTTPGVVGLTAQVDQTGKTALVSGGGENTFTLALATLTTGDLEGAPVETLSDKCVFAPGESQLAYCAVPKNIPAGLYPNDWLLGHVSFSDDIWFINFETGSARLLVDPQTAAGEEIDAINLMVNEDQTHLIFMNKKDLSLWSLRLN